MTSSDYIRTGADAQSSALSVSGAMALAKGALEGVTVRMLGEVSEVSNKPGYKAVYFTVKDQSASLPCMIWNNRYQSSGVQLRVGMLVELTGCFTLYAAKGRMNFDAFSISLAGEGNLRMRVAELARRLQAEGLMAQERKRPLPLYPERIGVVTSPRGAAVHDVLRTLRRRFPLAEVRLAGVPVEGVSAPSYLCEGLRCVVAAGVDVVLLVRGGGSFEDLMPFNDEGLARMVAACPVPIVTGIGHEPDTTIADMVSDFRASTPTAAAEAVVPQSEQISASLRGVAQSAELRVRNLIDVGKRDVERQLQRSAFGEPARLFFDEAMKLDDLSMRLGRSIPDSLQADKRKLTSCASKLSASLRNELDAPRERVGALSGRFAYQSEHLTDAYRGDLAHAASRLHDLSPLAVLSRGYSIVRTESGELARSVDQLQVDSMVRVQLSDGAADCQVKFVSSNER